MKSVRSLRPTVVQRLDKSPKIKFLHWCFIIISINVEIILDLMQKNLLWYIYWFPFYGPSNMAYLRMLILWSFFSKWFKIKDIIPDDLLLLHISYCTFLLLICWTDFLATFQWILRKQYGLYAWSVINILGIKFTHKKGLFYKTNKT